jgi:hypothetical protein
LSLLALNNLFEVARLRAGAAEKHPPQIIYFMLFGLGLGCSLLAGFGMAASAGHSWIHWAPLRYDGTRWQTTIMPETHLDVVAAALSGSQLRRDLERDRRALCAVAVCHGEAQAWETLLRDIVAGKVTDTAKVMPLRLVA